MLKPNYRQLEWYAREKTAFFHFGMNTFTEREWGDGTEDPALFNPTDLDCRQWIKAIKETGFDAAILTAKHHDGFCLWPSKYTEHSVKSSPYKNGNGDVVREFTDACREFGIKAGIYLSPWDRHEPSWGTDAYNDFYVGQLTELLTNYGEIYECWWDGAGSDKAHYDWERWANTVRTLQPNAVIFGSLGATPYVDVRWVGNEKGIAGKPCYSTVDYKDLEVEITANLNRGNESGEAYIPAEADVSIRPGWFYHDDQDTDVRTPHNLLKLWFASRGRNAGLLLNIPPDRRGLLCDSDIASLQGFHKLLTDALSNNLITPPDLNLCGDSPYEAVITLEKPITFNMFTLSEEIEHGNTVTDARVEIEQDGEWVEIAQTACVGNLFSEQIPTVTASKIKLCISSTEAPKLRNLGFYLIEEAADTAELPLTASNLMARRRTVVDTLQNGWDVNLGGIYPFNQIRLSEGVTEYLVEIFNGSSFETLVTGKNPNGGTLIVDLPHTVDGSYRLRITALTHTAQFDPTIKPKIYLV